MLPAVCALPTSRSSIIRFQSAGFSYVRLECAELIGVVHEFAGVPTTDHNDWQGWISLVQLRDELEAIFASAADVAEMHIDNREVYLLATS